MATSLPPLIRGWRAALLLVAVACATPGRARAECGDHVTILNGPVAKFDGASAAGHTPGPQKAPCSGPNCSRSPQRQAPDPAPAPTSGPQGKEAAVAAGSADERDGASARAPDPVPGSLVRRTTSIFHPPRLG
jgi:hypothetical protein